jgi:hypothetical protein
MNLSVPLPSSTAAEPSIDTTATEFGGDTISAKLRHGFDNASEHCGRRARAHGMCRRIGDRTARTVVFFLLEALQLVILVRGGFHATTLTPYFLSGDKPVHDC